MRLFFSDDGEDDAPTRIRVGSHLDIARTLAPYGEAGLHAAQPHRGRVPRFLGQPHCYLAYR